MTHDPLCLCDMDSEGCQDQQPCYPEDCHCACVTLERVRPIIEAQARADERSKYVLPDLPRSGEHVDWCRDLACYGCEEITDGVIAQSL